MAAPGKGTLGPAVPLGSPAAAWAMPHAESLRQEAPGSQQRAHKAEEQPPAAKQHLLMLCVPPRKPCSTASAFSLFIALPHRQEVFCPGW